MFARVDREKSAGWGRVKIQQLCSKHNLTTQMLQSLNGANARKQSKRDV